MKVIDIALKDLLRSSRSMFALVFMFGIPLLTTGLFFLMFGGLDSDEQEFSMPQTKVVIANLDQGGPGFDSAFLNLPFEPEQENGSINSIGDTLVLLMGSPALVDLFELSEVDSMEAARKVVDDRQAGVAVLIPSDLSAILSGNDPQAKATIELYQDPTLTFGPAIVHSVLNQFLDQLSGTMIAVNLVINQGDGVDPQAGLRPAMIGQVVQGYLDLSMQSQDPQNWVNVKSPASPEEGNNMLGGILGPIMGGMMIFYAFFSGTASAQTILEEEEKGTLPRLFTTPTSTTTILSGKFLAVFLTVIIQVTVLLLLGRLVFRIDWGALVTVGIVTLGIVLAASSFGIFVNSLLKSPKQGGIIYGVVLTVTGMLGMIRIFTLGSGGNPTLRTVSFLVPQGWAVEGLLESMSGSSVNAILFPFLILIGWSVVFFLLGVWRFQKRYA